MMSGRTNEEIVMGHYDLIHVCLDCQFAKQQDKRYKEDFANDLFLALLTYDNEKINDADRNHHFNALVTAIIRKNLYSKTSRYYKDYRRFENKTQEIDLKRDDRPDEGNR